MDQQGSLPDFKPSKAHEYTIGGGQFDKVTEAELKHSTWTTHEPPASWTPTGPSSP